MPELPALLDAIHEGPDNGPRWLALARWLLDNGRDDEAAAARVYWPVLRDNLARASLKATRADVARHAKVLGERAQEVERRTEKRQAAN
jgi:hypothetical protein